MNEQNLPDLPQQMADLRKVLRNMLEQNEALKAENAVLRTIIRENNPIHSLSNEQIDVKLVSHSLTDSPTDTNQVFHSHSDSMIDAKQVSHSLSDSPTDTKQVSHSLSDSPIEAEQAFEGNQLISSGMNQPVYTLPLKLETSQQNISQLATALLTQGLGNGKRQTALTAAQLLIHFYNEQPGEYKYLKRLTGYSDGGLGKMLMMLRRKGYLIKSGFQQHAVAANALKALHKAECK